MLNEIKRIRKAADYQQFDVEDDGTLTNIGNRMREKQVALEGIWPDMEGKRVLDIGCDFGFWSFLAASQGARKVIGLDRNRTVRNLGPVDLVRLNQDTEGALGRGVCEFQAYEAGQQFHDFPHADVVLLMSLYHHIYANTGGDHESVWYWLWRQCKKPGLLIWENPTGAEDGVVQANVHEALHSGYTEENIREAAERYFDITEERPSRHEATRVVWACKPKLQPTKQNESWVGETRDGAGGASKAFSWDSCRRVAEVEFILGEEVLPGSLNVELDEPFGWDSQYFRALVLDVKDRSAGLSSAWGYRPCRFYPVWIEGVRAWVMRFEGEQYPANFVELIAPVRLRDQAEGLVRIDR